VNRALPIPFLKLRRRRRSGSGPVGLGELILIAALGVVLWGVWVAPCYGDSTEPQLKAAFVYNFMKFIEWPQGTFPQPDSPLTVCILGQDTLADALDSVAGRTAQGRKVTVKRITKLAEGDRCQVLYVARSEKGLIGSGVRLARDGVLTVGDVPGFTTSGGTIGFFLTDSKIAFEINVDSAERTSLKISSQLLRLAKIVRDNGSRGQK
jgi:hypothetical protein